MTAARDRNLPASSKRKGFAIVMALSLLSIVFLLVISLVNLVGTDLSLADARKEKVLAQAHARMGMMVAIGEIQKHLGPDTRVSATADILDERIESGRQYESAYYTENSATSLGQAVANNQAIDLNENNQLDTVPFGQRYWTGVWKHRARRKGVDDNFRAANPLPKNQETGATMTSSPMSDTEYDPHPAIELAWLVSGNEGWSKKLGFLSSQLLSEYVEIPDGIPSDDQQRDILEGGIYGQAKNAWLDYQTVLESNLEGYEHPLIDLLDPDDEDSDTVWILRRPLLEEPISDEDDESGQWRSKLRGEPVKVKKTDIHPDDPEDRLHTHGSYAYWVGDEGVKTKINVLVPANDDSIGVQPEDDLALAKKPNTSFPGLSLGSGSPGEGGFGLELASNNSARNKLLTLGTLNEESILEGDAENNRKKVSAHYHSLSTDSFGVLADVRTGGLKRDLSHVFANARDWDETLEDATFNWLDDFLGFIYRERIHVLKSVPLQPNAKANQWNDTADTESINDYKGILAGPLWRTLGSFHNLYLKLSGNSQLSNLPADALPRFSGDNMVIFDPKNGQPEARGKPFWTQTQGPPMLGINTRLNWFRESNTRPGPKSHPIQPVLVEYKFSQVPTLSSGKLALAMYPSIALWNPYNVAISMNQLFVEIPMRQSTLNCMNPKSFDRWRKWVMWSGLWFQGGGGGGAIPEIPQGFPFARGPVGINGVMGTPGLIGLSMFAQVARLNAPEPRYSFDDFFRYGPNRYRYTRRTSPHQYTEDPILESLNGKYHFLWSNDPVNPETNLPEPTKERHLLLSINSLTLEPGEKAHFVVSPGYKYQWRPLPAENAPREFLRVPLMKGFDEHAFICETDAIIPADTPLAVQHITGKIHGVHPNQLTYYNPINAKPLGPRGYPESKGITMYSEDPAESAIGTNLYRARSFQERKPIFKITKSFDINTGYGQWSVMMNPIIPLQESLFGDPDFLPGNGIRIRFKLPGTADRIPLEQYNIRALVHSYQDGFGDNWKMERFIGSRYNGENFNFCQRLRTPYPTYTVISGDKDEPSMTLRPIRSRFVDFYEFANGGNYDLNLTIDEAILPLDPPNYSNLEDGVRDSIEDLSPFSVRIVPKVTSASSSIGYFHDLDEVHGTQMSEENNAVLFEVPSSPMLSILQFRHANLNDYSHGPSYVLGNSYATPQVARYKTWGRVKAISWDPEGGITFDIPNNESASQKWKQAFLVPISPWEWFISEFNLYMPSLAPVRNVDAQNEHQNTTLDHSYYANRALLDGFLMSGVGHGQWAPKTPARIKEKFENLEPGQRLSLYRNPRLFTFLRDSELSETSYGDLSDNVQSGDDASFRYQTLAADLLLDGAFNINSTSVDAWVSHLTALKGKTVPMAKGSYPSTVTTVPRFLDVPEQNSWNKIASLSNDEVVLLAYCLVEQIKLRGPFLSFADFTNRRIIGTPVNLIPHRITEWTNKAQETRDSVLGLRGTMQAAIAEAKLNSTSTGTSTSTQNPLFPSVPSKRFTGPERIDSVFVPAKDMNFISSEFGIPAFCTSPRKQPRPGDPFGASKILSQPEFRFHTYDSFNPHQELSYVSLTSELGQGISVVDNFFVGTQNQNGVQVRTGNIKWGGQTFSFKAGWEDYEGSASFGEAPDNLLAVEDTSTAANKPGWIMQSDVLSPLAPVTSVRSDTFVIRVMGESKALSDQKNKGRAWIELTVQRTPDYVKPYLDAPHHRPHEPFEDRNFNGYWDNDPSFREHWLDLNLNGMDDQGQQTEDDARPDLPAEGIYPDGLGSDLPLNLDPEEEPPDTVISTIGINQRFGRKFKIIKFRWIKEQDV